MKYKVIIGLFSASILLSSCVNQENINTPTTQTAAVVGAITGAVVGGNTGSTSGKRIATGAVLGALGAGALGTLTGGQEKQTGGWE